VLPGILFSCADRSIDCDRADGGTGAGTIDVQEATLSEGIDTVIGGDMADTIFMDPVDLLS
jgi:hypothetical protein